MTRYITFTVAEEYEDTLVPVLDSLVGDRNRSYWICENLMNAIKEETIQAIGKTVKDKDG